MRRPGQTQKIKPDKDQHSNNNETAALPGRGDMCSMAGWAATRGQYSRVESILAERKIGTFYGTRSSPCRTWHNPCPFLARVHRSQATRANKEHGPLEGKAVWRGATGGKTLARTSRKATRHKGRL